MAPDEEGRAHVAGLRVARYSIRLLEDSPPPAVSATVQSFCLTFTHRRVAPPSYTLRSSLARYPSYPPLDHLLPRLQPVRREPPHREHQLATGDVLHPRRCPALPTRATRRARIARIASGSSTVVISPAVVVGA